jgi:hypothetical protein
VPIYHKGITRNVIAANNISVKGAIVVDATVVNTIIDDVTIGGAIFEGDIMEAGGTIDASTIGDTMDGTMEGDITESVCIEATSEHFHIYIMDKVFQEILP